MVIFEIKPLTLSGSAGTQ